MPMLVEFEPPTVRVPPILLHSAGQQMLALGPTARTVQCPD